MTVPPPTQGQRMRPKRIIVCCDGTWENSLETDAAPLTNVTRISRSLRRVCSDGTSQVIFYHPGVGTSGSWLDSVTGGAFGMGLGADIREAYNFICSNYMDGDDIILTGFSRGAFTARSIADLIASIGLLTTEGMAWFYSIFEDYENMADKNRSKSQFLDDSYKFLTKYNGEKDKAKILWENKRKEEYKRWLKSKAWTRDTFRDGRTLIKIKAVAVWDTVGSLGIPPMSIVGIRGSSSHTQVSTKVENAFQALSMDEPRGAFRPALWERLEGNTTTRLKQVWFPGNHGNVGGGWYDQQIACITLAWICDQLTTVGVEFSPRRLTHLFIDALRYGAAHPYPFIPATSIFIPSWVWNMMLRTRTPLAWATTPSPCRAPTSSQHVDRANCTMKDRHPKGRVRELWNYGGRPWGLGQTRYPNSWFTIAAGTIVRRPGCFMRVDPDTNADTQEPLLNTNERIHSCVRVRLACKGMDMDDRQAWPCPSLLEDDSHHPVPLWRLERGSAIHPQEMGRDVAFWKNEIGRNVKGYDPSSMYRIEKGDGQWKWVFEENAVVKNGVGKKVRPRMKVLPEEPLVGYWERHLLMIMRGASDVWRLSEGSASTMARPALSPRKIV